MSDRPNFSKSSPVPPSGGTGGTGGGPTKPAPPRFVLYAVAALALSGIAAVLASAALYTGSVKSWVRDNTRDSLSNQMSDKFDDIKKAGPSGGARAADLNALRAQIKSLKSTPNTQLTPIAQNIKSQIDDLKPGASKDGKPLFDDLDKQADNVRDIDSQTAKSQKGALVSSIIVLVALGIAAGAAYRGRYWARWATLGLWVLATLTGTLAGIGYVLSIGADIPALFKVPAFIAGLSLIVAVVLTNLRPSIAYFNLTKPVRGTRPQRRGLFSPPPPRNQPATEPAATPEPTSDRVEPPRGRTKQRTSDAATAKGAELARTRAKASKSRRTGV